MGAVEGLPLLTEDDDDDDDGRGSTLFFGRDNRGPDDDGTLSGPPRGL